MNAHQALGRRAGFFGQDLKPNGRFNIVAQHRFPGGEITLEHQLERFDEQSGAKRGIRLGPRFDSLSEIACKRLSVQDRPSLSHPRRNRVPYSWRGSGLSLRQDQRGVGRRAPRHDPDRAGAERRPGEHKPVNA